MRVLVLVVVAGCQLHLRPGVAAPTRHGFGSADVSLAFGGSGTKELDTARVGGGAMLHVASYGGPTTLLTAAQGHADVILRRNYKRQIVLATRADVGVGSEILDEDALEEPRTFYSLGVFVGPGIALAPNRRDLTWDTIALGFTARRTTIGDESAWFLGAALELTWSPDLDRFSTSSSP